MTIVDAIIGWYKGTLTVIDIPSIQLTEGTLEVSSIVELITPYCAPGFRPDAQDAVSQVVYSKWLKNSYSHYKEYLRLFDLGDYDVKFDCDDFAINYWVWCRNLYARQSGTLAEAPAIGVCKYPGHVINWAITEGTLQFFEPQTGKFVPTPQGIYWMQF